jgi:hypothetical protein
VAARNDRKRLLELLRDRDIAVGSQSVVNGLKFAIARR